MRYENPALVYFTHSAHSNLFFFKKHILYDYLLYISQVKVRKNKTHVIFSYYNSPFINFQGLAVMVGRVKDATVAITCHEVLQAVPSRSSFKATSLPLATAAQPLLSMPFAYSSFSGTQIMSLKIS